MKRLAGISAALAAVALSAAAPAQAEWKPTKPVRIIVPWSAGGSTDQVVRVLAAEMEKALGQKVVVVNQTGGGIGKGDVVADMLDVWGRPVGNGVIRSSYEGIVLGRTHGVYFYPGQPILTMAVRDGDPLTAPYPDTFH